jgi:hypothetical protein
VYSYPVVRDYQKSRVRALFAISRYDRALSVLAQMYRKEKRTEKTMEGSGEPMDSVIARVNVNACSHHHFGDLGLWTGLP